MIFFFFNANVLNFVSMEGYEGNVYLPFIARWIINFVVVLKEFMFV